MSTWKETERGLTRTFTFKDFKEAFAFMTQVAFEAEAMGHHPEWTNVYNRVEVRLSTHDAGGRITRKDHDLAAAIDRIAAVDPG